MRNKQRKPSNKRGNNKEGVSENTNKTRKPSKGYSEELKDSKDTCGSNDPNWYATDPALLRDAASYPFSWATGPIINPEPVDFSYWKNAEVTTGKLNLSDFSAGGLQSIYLIPSIGSSQDKDSPINIASFSLFSFVRHANSGASNYDAVDLMQYVLAMSSVYSYINFCQRLYGMAFTFSQRNSYLPEVMFASVGIDYADIRANLANFRLGLNILINQAASFAVPNTIPLLVRQSFVYSGLYTEGSSIKDQMYIYNPSGFWYFQYSSDDLSGYLKLLPFYSSSETNYNDPKEYLTSTGTLFWRDNAKLRDHKFLLDYGTFLMKNLVNNQDFKIMSGDIYKAFGNNTISLASVPEAYQILPQFNIGVLEQMSNATILGKDQLNTLGWSQADVIQKGIGAFDILQDGNHAYLMNNQYLNPAQASDAHVINMASVYGEGKTLTTTTDQTSPELVMESSRLMLSLIPKTDTTITYTTSTGGGGFVQDVDVLQLASGSEVAVDCLLFWTPNSISTTIGETVKFGFNTSQITYANVLANPATVTKDLIIGQMGQSRQFRFRPPMHRVWVTSGYALSKDLGCDHNLDNYTRLSPNDIGNLHRSAIINQINVPYVHKV